MTTEESGARKKVVWRWPRLRGAVVALVGVVTCVTLAGSIARAAAPTRVVYYSYCGVEGKPGKCELRTMPETLASSAPVSTMPAFYAECGPNAIYPRTTVSEDGTTAVTLEDISKGPGAFDDKVICRLVVTNLATGESHVLPAYSPKLLESIMAKGWTVSPNGQNITINATNGVYIQDAQTGTAPQLLHTGFTPQGVGWYPESSRLIIDGPGSPLGGRGPVDTANRLFEFTVSGRLLGRWLIKPVSTYLFEAPFIQISPTGQIYFGGGAALLPGAKPNIPAGYYLLGLGKHVSVQLITRVSPGVYGGTVSSFGVDTESGLIFFNNDVHKMCSVSTSHGTRHCVNIPGEGIQLALSPS